MSKRTQRGLIILGSFAVLAIAAVIVAYGDEIVTFVSGPAKKNTVNTVQSADSAAYRAKLDAYLKADTSAKRITDAEKNKKITHSEALVQYLKLALDPASLEPSFVGTVQFDPQFTGPDPFQNAITESFSNRKQFSPAQLKEIDRLTAPATEDGKVSYNLKAQISIIEIPRSFVCNPPITNAICGKNFMIHKESDQDFTRAKIVLSQLESDYTQSQDSSKGFSFTPPRHDGNCQDKRTNGLIDVYLVKNLPSYADGFAVPCLDSYGVYQGGYIQLSSEIPLDVIPFTATHEFTHLLQFEAGQLKGNANATFIEGGAEVRLTTMSWVRQWKVAIYKWPVLPNICPSLLLDVPDVYPPRPEDRPLYGIYYLERL
ncbi:MAG: hypothetical protein U0517_02350 [Candidatus Andersenbacteria bacterium]